MNREIARLLYFQPHTRGRLFLAPQASRAAPQIITHLRQNARPPTAENVINMRVKGAHCAPTSTGHATRHQTSSQRKLLNFRGATKPMAGANKQPPDHHSDHKPAPALSDYDECPSPPISKTCEAILRGNNHPRARRRPCHPGSKNPICLEHPRR